MFLPRFTTRAALWATTLAATVYVVVGLAVREYAWAIGISAAVGTLVLVLCVHALMYLLLRWSAEAFGLQSALASGVRATDEPADASHGEPAVVGDGK